MAKRPADADAPDSNPAPAKKARTVYVVTVTHFTDDYKARGNDWSDGHTLGLFRSHRRAQARADRETLSIVQERLVDKEEDSDFAEYWEHTSDGEGDAERTLNMKRVHRDLYELEARFSEGEFVPRKFSIDIEEALLDDRASDEESASSDQE